MLIPSYRRNSAGILVRSSKMDKLRSVSRFLVRQGSKGWFVYDRERKGPALVGTGLAEKLTKEHADQIQRRLTAESERKAPRVGSNTR